MSISKKKLKFWSEIGYNVLLKGRHGFGKTAQVEQVWNEMGLKWRYFSAATMDPWVDFVGVPKEKQDENGKSYLELILPKDFADGEVEAIFFDEFNRAPDKVRNAVMELIQFGSINGRKFPNLKMIWAAINVGEEYDVEELDPAQEDRFQIHVNVVEKPSLAYFTQKYGEAKAKSAIEWWNALDKEAQLLVSARRLDYALDIYEKGGDMRDVLPERTNVSKLTTMLSVGTVEKRAKDIFKQKDHQAAKAAMKDQNFFTEFKRNLFKANSSGWLDFWTPALDDEKFAIAFGDTLALRSFVSKTENNLNYAEQLHSLYNNSDKNSKHIKLIELLLNGNPALKDRFKELDKEMRNLRQKLA